MFEGDSADMCAKICWLMSMGGRAEGLACADPAVIFLRVKYDLLTHNLQWLQNKSTV